MLAPNTIVGGRYRVVKTLGGGGMKLVYLAEDLRLAARSCALAEMVDSFTNPDAQTQAVAAFQREADMLARLSNEHIPRVFDRFSEANHHFLVMEYIEGVTLEEELHKNGGKIPPDRVIAIAAQVLDTLEYLHNLTPPVIYRDLKPSNLMIAPGGQAKLIDFGIARHFQPLTNATMIGTQGYAPPEQYRGKVETRSDLYALGATMHQALSGRDPAVEAPFSFPPLRKLCPDLNPTLAAIVDQSLAYDVVNRPYDAEEFKRRLFEAANSGAATASTNAAATTNHANAKPQLRLPLEVTRPGANVESPATPPSTPVSPTVLTVATEIRCPSCARAIPADSRFCSYCAADLSPGATPKFTANPNDATVVLSPQHTPTPHTGARGPVLERHHSKRHSRSGEFRTHGREHRRRARRPLLLLLLIFLGGFVLMKLLRGAATSNPAPPTYNTGSSGYPPAGPEGAYADQRLNALRMALNAGGYGAVQFRPDGDAIELWGTVPDNFAQSQIEMICMTLGFSKLEVHVQVADNGGMG
jgi:serine/threonine protein kinase